MISSVKLTFMIISAIICIVLPIGLAIIVTRKYKASFLPILTGGLVFFVFQMILRIPMLTALAKMEWYQNLAKNKIFISLFLGLTAGVFEEVGRFIGFKILRKEKFYNYKNGIAFGIGHGGVEAILLGGFTYLSNVTLSIMMNNGVFENLMGENLPTEALETVKAQLIDTKSTMFLLGGFERIFAIVIQIALTLVVLYAVKYRKNIWILVAILLHAVIDTPIVLMPLIGVNIFVMEAYVFLCAIVGLVFIIKSKELFSREKTF